jgi:hypothetical protein
MRAPDAAGICPKALKNGPRLLAQEPIELRMSLKSSTYKYSLNFLLIMDRISQILHLPIA